MSAVNSTRVKIFSTLPIVVLIAGCAAGEPQVSIDPVAPRTFITSAPEAVLVESTVRFEFNSDDAAAQFECSLDAADFLACESPVTYSGLNDGKHSFAVRAIDRAGNKDSAPPSVSFTIDTLAPASNIVSGPAALDNHPAATFTFESDDATAQYACRVDGAAFAPCVSPWVVTALADGAHSFTVYATDPQGNAGAEMSWSWTLDATAPDTLLTAGMPQAVSVATAEVSFDATENATFECSLNGAPFAACASPYTAAALLPGPQTFEVRAIDAAGNTDAVPVFISWFIDLVAPETLLLGAPANPVSTATAAFVFAANEAFATFQCSLNGGAFFACTSPETPAGLVDGTHVFEVRSIDPSGNIDLVPENYTWRIDTVPPETTLSPMAALVSATTAQFTFTSNESASFVCSLDGAAFQPCASPQAYLGLLSGPRQFQVRAIDLAGNVESVAKTRNWSIDITPPELQVTEAPAAITSATSATIRFTADGTADAIDCSFDLAGFSACASPYLLTALGEGPHRLRVRARDGLGNRALQEVNWRVDLTPPETTITAAPAGPTNATTAEFTFTASEPVGTFRCSLNGEAFTDCSSPFTVDNVPDGSATFEVAAVDLAGNIDPTPATRIWDVDTVAPELVLSGFAEKATQATSASFVFSSADATASFLCSLNGAAAAACTSPFLASPLDVGPHRFSVIAVDAVGNASAPASHAWTIFEAGAEWRGVSAGDNFACAVKFDQTLWCWGDNQHGQLGIGTQTNQGGPVLVAGSGWVEVTTGLYAACGLKNDGSLWCWGYNYHGYLGQGDSGQGTNRGTPTRVGSGNDWKSIDSGAGHVCATKTDGSLWCWGQNMKGQVGNDNTTDQAAPVQVDTAIQWAHLSAGGDTTCGLDAEHELWCWGSNFYFQYGDGGNTESRKPKRIGTRWLNVEQSGVVNCGVRDDGTLWCWGYSMYAHGGGYDTPGRIGLDADWAYAVPRLTYQGPQCAVKQDFSLWCWVDNSYGQAGIGDTPGEVNTPQRVGVGSERWAAASVGYEIGCGVDLNGALSCWGRNNRGGVGAGVTGMKLSPARVSSTTDWSVIKTSSHSCGIKTGGDLWCWGLNAYGQVGDGTKQPQKSMQQIDAANDWTSVSMGKSHSCALKSDSSLWCWGAAAGDGQPGWDDTVTPVSLGTAWAALPADNFGDHTCAVKVDGTLWCWGANGAGQLGNGSAGWTVQETPLKIGSATDWAHPATATSIAQGEAHTCVVKPNGTLWCWGANYFHQLGDGSTTNATVPKQIGSATDWASVATGYQHTCAITKSGELWCTELYASVPISQVGTASDWKQATGGFRHTCGVKDDHSLWCWGESNKWGELGMGDQVARPAPTQVGLDLDWQSLSGAWDSVCATKTDGTVWCWGSSPTGGHGDGTAWYSTPVVVTP